LTVNLTYNGLVNAPTNAGSYTVIGTINDANYSGSATNTLIIAKADAIVTLDSLSQTYDGSAKAVTATTTPSGLVVNLTYNGSATVPTGAGSYAVVGTINDANYQGNATGTLVIDKGSGAIAFGSLNQRRRLRAGWR
jgi:predicted aconitase with swiveling domain